MLTERPAHLRSHAGQVAFPGGRRTRATPGPVAAACARRARRSGSTRRAWRSSAELPALYLPPERVRGHPRAGVVGPARRRSAVDPAEVARVVRAPLSELTDPARRFTVTHPSGYVGPAFDVDGLLSGASRPGCSPRCSSWPASTATGTRPTGARCPSGWSSWPAACPGLRRRPAGGGP